MHRLTLSPGACTDILTTIRWYQCENPDLAARFKHQLRATFIRIRTLPHAFPRVNELVRLALLRGFPYAVYFFIRNRTILIVAVLHQHRSDLPGSNLHGEDQ